MTTPTPETVREIAGRLYRGEPCTREDAEMLLWCATQWQRVNKALDEIANDALEQSQIRAAQIGHENVVLFDRRMRVAGGEQR